jgi:hypothetical protein
MLCSPLKVDAHFGGRSLLHGLCLLHSSCCFLFGLYFCHEDGSDVSTIRRLTFNGLHAVMSQKIELFSFFRLCRTLLQHGREGHAVE